MDDKLKKPFLTIILGATLIAGFVKPVAAGQVILDVFMEVYFVDPTLDPFFQNGNTGKATITYDSDAQDFDADPALGAFFGAVFGLEGNIGGYNFTQDQSSTNSITVFNSDDPQQSDILTLNTGVTGPILGNDINVQSYTIILNAPFDTFDSDALTEDLWPPAHDNSNSSDFEIIFEVPGSSPHSISGSILDIQAIPLPAAVWFFGSGLLGLVGIARRKKTV